VKLLKKYWIWLVYAVILAVYVINIVFFDEHNIINRRKNQQYIEQLEMQKQSYLDNIKANKETIFLLKDTNNNAFLEKYAREKYFFKKVDEDIFVIKQ
jgi:Septum formation initiator.